MPRVEDPVSEPSVEARFACARCGREAARLTLVRGIAGPGARSADMLPDLGHRPVIDAGPLSTTMGAPRVLDDPAFARTPASADPAAIFAVLDVTS